jgi:pyrroloquinoline quinone biosynthesis protein B
MQRPGRLLNSGILLLTMAALGGCGQSAPAPKPETERVPVAGAPRLRVVGTVQDGGLPHAACNCIRCEAARREPTRRRWIASLALLFPQSREVYLIDATPDLPSQLQLLEDFRRAPDGGVDRSPLDGVLLTHAHIGHYLGLAFFGFEAVATHRLPVFCTPRMASFLRSNGPWDQLVRMENVTLREIGPGESLRIEGVRVTPLAVPHRDEYTDTLGYLLEGPRRTILYVPDTDSWEAWQTPLPEMLDGVDVAFLDGTFYSADELPGRDVTAIGHPLIIDTMKLLQPRVRAGALRVYFTHLNHSNPALEPDSEALRSIEARGFGVLREGQEFGL